MFFQCGLSDDLHLNLTLLGRDMDPEDFAVCRFDIELGWRGTAAPRFTIDIRFLGMVLLMFAIFTITDDMEPTAYPEDD